MNKKVLRVLSRIMAVVIILTSIKLEVYAEFITKDISILSHINQEESQIPLPPEAEITLDLPESAVIGTEHKSNIDIMNFDELNYIEASLNGVALDVSPKQAIVFIIGELGQNVLNIKAYDMDENYIEKIYYIRGEELEDTEVVSSSEVPSEPSDLRNVRMTTFAAFSPQVEISTPKTTTIITEPTDIVGTVNGTGITHYTLEYAAASDAFVKVEKIEDLDQFYTVFAEGTTLVNNGILGKLDTTTLTNGFYSIRLTAHGENESKSIEISLSVEGKLKIGNYSTIFNDMDIPVQNFPLTVQRGYDSRTKQTSGDFGYGWNLSMTAATLTKSGILGEGWKEESKKGSFGMTTYYFAEDYKHEISIDWGNGKVEKFKMTPSPNQQSMYRLQWIDSINYVAQGKSKSKLEAIGNNSDFIFNSNALLDYSMNVYNPTKFKLTTQDGTIYIFSDKNGIEEIKDTQGNKITFDKKGIYHSDGKSILFERDSENRITKITGPTGKTVTYEYDFNGDLSSVTDISGEITNFVYNEEHYLMEIIDPRGVQVSRNEYNNDGKLIAVVDALGNRIALDSDLMNKRDSITDRLGHTTVFEYDNRGNIITITDALGNVTRQTYDVNNNLTTKTDALGNTAKYEYAEDGKLVSVTNAHGNQVKNTYNTKGELSAVNGFGFQQAGFTYNSYGQTLTTKDALGNTINYSYEENGSLKSIADSIGVLQQLTYDSEGNVKTTMNGTGDMASFTYDQDDNALSKTVTRTNTNGFKETITENYQYDIADNVTKIIYSDGTFTNLEYNQLGDMSASIDTEGRRTTYEYDLFRNLVKVNYFDNTFEHFEYDAENRNSKAVNRYGKEITMTYDAIGNLKTKTYQNGSMESLEYDKKYRLVSVTDLVGGVTRYEYDAIDRNTAIVDPLGNRTEFVYNTLSQLGSIKDPKGKITKFEYDKNGNQTKVTLPDGNFISAVYDARGRFVSQTDQNKYVTKYSYDGSDRLLSVVDAAGSTWSYSYNEIGELIAVTDPNLHSTKYEYDTEGRIIKTINAMGKEASSSYDSNGNRIVFTDFAGQISYYSYDEHDRVIEVKVGSDTQILTYNGDSLLDSVTDASGTIKYVYDDMNHLVKVQQADGMVMEYTYDIAGRQTKLSTTFGSTNFEYDILNRLIAVVDKDGRKTVYTYDLNGNTSTITYSNGIVTAYFYNDSNALIGEKITNRDGSLIKEYAYTLGKSGERLKVVETGGRTVTYTYDALYRLTKEAVLENATTKTITYAYDKLSNRTSKNENGTITNYEYNALNQLVKENNVFYAYDLNGNQISKVNGAETTAYVYDAFNRLVRAAIQNGQNAKIEEYEYDWQGNRMSKSTDTERVRYLVDTNNWIAHVVAETDHVGNLKTHYTRGNDVLINQVKGSETSYYLYDGQGSVRMLANENNAITDTYSFDAYGVLTGKTGVTENDYLYNGEQFDKTTELYYLRARYMQPSTGTFITMDTYQGKMHDPVSLHKYMYANANPIMYKDPTGYSSSLGESLSVMGIMGISSGIATIKVGAIFSSLAFQASVIVVLSFLMYETGILEDLANGVTDSWEICRIVSEILLDSIKYSKNNWKYDGNDGYGDESLRTERVGHQNGNSPRNNKNQNKDFKRAVKLAGLTIEMAERLHRMISKQGYSFEQILEMAYDMMKK